MERSRTLLRFLGALGHRIEKSETALRLKIDDLVVFAAYAWHSLPANIHIQPKNGTYTLTSTLRAVRRYGVFFDITVVPNYDVHWLKRFL